MKKGSLNGHSSTESALETQIGGNHYSSQKIQPIEFIYANNLDFIDGNIVKYVVRNKKGENKAEKYDKIIHYCKLAKEIKCG